MKRIIELLLTLMIVLSLCACGGDNAGSANNSTETLTIDAICVDDSYRDDDNSSLRMVYLFYTLSPKETNMEVDSMYTTMTINDTNDYESNNYVCCKNMPNYYYSSYIEDIYMGETIKVAATFKVPEGDLVAGRKITFSDYQISDLNKIQLSTDDIQHFDGEETMAAVIDPDGYEELKEKRLPADAETVARVENAINGYYFSFYVNSTGYELEFFDGDQFELRTSFVSNSGTYTVKKGYIFCTYSETGYTVEIPYSFENGEISLDVIEAFDINA